ncbi:MAG: sugar ABC transporter permease [Chloroflexota bacterium]|nr:sugar ABC transporter permease [Chloroflexota bacterium]
MTAHTAEQAAGKGFWLTRQYNRLTLRQRRTLMGYVFIAPFILGFLLWWMGPAAVAGYLTFHKWNFLSAPKFVGMANFSKMLSDPILAQSLKVTIIFSAISVPLGLVFAFFLANLINAKVRGIAVFRTIYFLPSIVPAVANAILWAWLFNTEFGLINYVIRAFGGPKIGWLQDPNWVMLAFVILTVWGVGGSMIIFLAGLQGIPQIFYEAAEIDGAGRWQRMLYVTLPMMSPIIFFNLVIGFINSFQVFVSALLITNGGPQHATLFLVLYVYRTAFQSQKMGYAAVLSWLLFAILMLLSFIVFRYIGSRVYYENPGD